MDLMRREPMREMSNFKRQLDRFFDFDFIREAGRDFFRSGPRVDIYQTDTEVIVHAELPGVTKEDVEILADEHSLTIRGEMRRETEQNEDDYFHRERYYGSFHRVLPLPTEIIPEETKALFTNGVLEVRMTKSEPAKNRGIRVEIN